MKYKRVPTPKTEAQHQKALFDWAAQPSVRKRWPDLKLMHHIPNGGARDAIEGKHLQQQGVKPGVPDIFLPIPKQLCHGLYIEMKRPGGTLTDEQQLWLAELTRLGYLARDCYGWESARELIEWYMTLPE